jgi:hypothetical protein
MPYRMWRGNGPSHHPVCLFACQTDTTSQRIQNTPARPVSHFDECHLVRARNHPRRCIRCMMDLVQIVGRVYIQVGGIGIHLLANIAGTCNRPV